MELTLWELFVFLVVAPVGLATCALSGINRWCKRLDGYRDPASLGRSVLLTEAESTGACIGHLGDVPIFDHVVMRGRTFLYDRLVRPDYQLRVLPDELFMAPGLVYRAPY
jgi:hypothetical protein